MLADLIRARDLVWAFAQRDLAVRYRSSVLGWMWSLVQPIANVLFFSVVFLVIFQVQAPPLGRGWGESYPAFLLCGLVTWNLFASMQLLSITTLRSCRPLMSKVAFPGWAPVMGAQLVQALQVLMEFAVLVLFLLALRNVSWTWLLAIPILLGTVLFAMGVGLMVAVLGARVGDTKEFVATGLTILYFATPVLYPMSMAEGRSVITTVIALNPMAWYVQSMHDVMYSLTAPSITVLVALLVGGAAVFLLGLAVFRRSSVGIVEVL